MFLKLITNTLTVIPRISRCLLGPQKYILVALLESSNLLLSVDWHHALSINFYNISIPCRCVSTKRIFPTKHHYQWINPWKEYTTIKCWHKITLPSPTVLSLRTHCLRQKVWRRSNKRPSKLWTSCIPQVIAPRECPWLNEENWIEKESKKGRHVWGVRLTCFAV